MRLQIVKSKNAESFYVVKSTYINKKHSSRVVEKLGTLEEVKIKANGQDPYVWAKEYAKELTKQEKENYGTILIKKFRNKQMELRKTKFIQWRLSFP